MRRFIALLLLLVVTLFIGRRAESAGIDGEAPADTSLVRATGDRATRLELDVRAELTARSDRDLDRESERYLDSARHARRTSSVRDREDRWRRRRDVRTYPRRRRDRVTFRLEDRDYESVAIAGSFNDWDDRPMRLIEGRDYWEVSLRLGRGKHRYTFVVVDERGERTRTDPSNPRRTKRDGRWVSEIVVGKNDRVLSARADFDLDVFEGFELAYQRVDGFVASIQPEFRSNQPFTPTLRSKVGYGFKSERWSASLTLLQPLAWRSNLQAKVSLYDQTDYTDQTGVGDLENTLSSWVFREDSRDYYRREGVSLGLVARPERDVQALVEIRSDDYGSLESRARAGWGGRERFLPNPAIDEGTMRSLYASLRFGTDLRHVDVAYEYSNDGFLSSEFDFSQITAQYRTRLRMSHDQYLDLRVKAGTNLQGTLPVQKRYVLGGIGTIRGYRYQSVLELDPDVVRTADDPAPFGGQRMFLANAEYAIGVEHDVQLVLLFDTGLAWEDQDADLRPGDWKSSVGVGFQLDGAEGLRLDVVKSVDGGDSDVIVQARLDRGF